MPALQDSINAGRVAAEAADRIKATDIVAFDVADLLGITEESREFYGLERLWRDCPAIDLELAHPETAEHAEDAAVTTE